MQKILQNKKLFITLLAGVLLLTAAVGAGTWAWFTGSATAEGNGQFVLAKVGIEADGAEFNAYDFYPGATYEFTRYYQDLFENYVTDDPDVDPWTKSAEFDERMQALYFGWNGDPLRIPLTAQDVPEPNAAKENNRVYLIQNPFNKTIYDGGTGSTDVWNLTPGSILEAKYSFTTNGAENSSTIPVYFRISAAELYNAELDADIVYSATALAIITGTRSSDTEVVAPSDPEFPYEVQVSMMLIYGDDGYYYCPIPLSPIYGWNVEVINAAYIYGWANGNEIQGQRISFTKAEDIVVDVIQATNNAVYLVDGWKAVADYLVPYVDADLYDVYLSDFYNSYPEIQ